MPTSDERTVHDNRIINKLDNSIYWIYIYFKEKKKQKDNKNYFIFHSGHGSIQCFPTKLTVEHKKSVFNFLVEA